MNLSFKFINYFIYVLLLLFTAQVYAKESAEVDKLFTKGMTQSKNSHWLEAKKSFELLLKFNKQLHRARVELAIVYMHLNQHDLAIIEFDKVLSINGLPSNVHSNILNLKIQSLTELNEALVKKLNLNPDRNKSAFQGHAEVAFGYDDNVRFTFGDYFLEDDPYYDSYFIELNDGTILEVSSDGYVYDIDRIPLFKNEGQYEISKLKKGSQFNDLRLNLQHQHQFDTSDKVIWTNLLNLKKINNVDLQSYSKFQVKLDSEINWRLNKKIELSYLAHYRLLQRDSETQVQTYGLEANLAYFNDFGKWQFGFNWMDRVYEESIVERDTYILVFDEVKSNTRTLSLTWSKLFFSNDLLLLTKFDYLETDEQTQYPDPSYYELYGNSDHTGIKYSGAMIYSFTPALKLSLTMINLTLDYSDDDTYYGDQQDKSQAIRGKLNYRINDNFDIFITGEKTTRNSDQYEGIKSDKSLVKAGIRLNF